MNAAIAIGVAPDHAEAARRHEVVVLLRVVDLLQRRRELAGDRLRQPLRAGEAAPSAGVVIDAHRLPQGRHVGELRIARLRHDREAAGLAGLDHGARLRDRAGHDIDAARRQILHRGRRAVRRHPRHLTGLESHRRQPADQRQMPDAALAGARCLELAGRRRLDGVGKLLHRLVRRVRFDLDAGRILVHQGKRRVAPRRELGQPLPMHHRDLDRDDAERVAVGRGGGDRRVADDAGAADAVDDIDRLAEILFEQSRDDARGGIGAAAGAPRADQLDWPGGVILLRERGCRTELGSRPQQLRPWPRIARRVILVMTFLPRRPLMAARCRGRACYAWPLGNDKRARRISARDRSAGERFA